MSRVGRLGWDKRPSADDEPPRFRLVAFDALKPSTAPNYLVKGLIPRVGLVVVWGPPKCGKSFWISDLAIHVALGWEYRGRRVHQGPVVYCAFEGADGFKARAEAFRQRFLAEETAPVPFYLSASPMDLITDHEELTRSIGAYLRDGSPVAVVLDTLNRSLTGSESSDEDMSAYIRAADAIRDAFDCVVIIVHHCGIDATRPRGHTSLAGAVDAQLAVTRDATDNLVATVEFMKDGPEGATVTSRLEQIELGKDADGDPITSCVVVEVDQMAPSPKRGNATLPRGAQIALKALQIAITEAGEVPPASAHIPAATRTVSLDLWREHAYAKGISSSKAARAKQAAFQRSAKALVAANVVGVWRSHCWLS